MVTDGSQRTYLHDNQGPRVVDAGQLRGAPRMHQKDSAADDREVKRSRRTSSHKSPSKSESGHRHKSSNSQSKMKSSVRPKWELDVIGQPHRVVPLGMEVETSVMASLRFPTADLAIDGSNVDITRLFAVASLVKDTRSGERVPVESGMLTGQKLFDSVHEIPEEHVETMARSQPNRVALGYFTFPGLLIRQAGSFRIRTTLIQMPVPGSSQQGATTILAVDSEPIKVERRPSNPQRAHF
ncbi:hypothetical protein Q7P35_004917 [Cladosporium inversicolor]